MEIEQERNGNGAGMEREWNRNGMGTEWERNGNGAGMERERNRNGSSVEGSQLVYNHITGQTP